MWPVGIGRNLLRATNPNQEKGERMKKIIKFYRTNQYGVELEFVHPDSEADGRIIRQLTGQKTLNGVTRELIRDLTGCAMDFAEVLAPRVSGNLLPEFGGLARILQGR